MADDWEKYHASQLLALIDLTTITAEAVQQLQSGNLTATTDYDGDGKTAGERYQQASAGNAIPTNNDADGDGIEDSLDADPDDAEINWEKTPETSYFWVELPTTSPPNDSDVLASPAERNQPIAVNKHAQVLYGSGLWNTGTATWATLPQRGSLGGIDNDAGEVSTITWPALIYTALNDEGDVVGHSDWSDSWFMEIFTIGMVWKTDGTGIDKYKTPDYFMRSKSVNNQPYDTLGVAMISAIADDGTVNCATENIEDSEWLHYDSVAGGNLVTVAETVDRWASSGQNYLSGDILDKNRSLALKFDGSQSWKLLLREDGEQEVVSGIAEELDLSSPYYYAESNYGFTSSISLAPNPLDLKQDQTEPGERLWLSLYPRSKNSQVYLEKRVGGTGPARWHNPPSMAQGAKRLNARGEAITDTHLWRNGKYELLNDIVSKPDALTIDKAIDLSSNGIILVQATEEGTQKTGLLLPVELISDLNNDGEIDSKDNPLRDVALASGASDEEKEKGTEYLFVNDELSNGLSDVEDTLAPEGTTDDDDIQEIKVSVGIKAGTVRFDHPSIGKLQFFEDKPCTTEVTFPFDLKAKDLPETLYIRTEGEFDGQEEGDLVLKFKPSANAEEIDAAKLKLTIVHRVGDVKYFNASRDYILEKNTRFHARNRYYEDNRFDYDTAKFTVVTMREKAALMFAIDASRRPGGNQLKGIDAVSAAYPGINVVINGNQTFFADDRNKFLAGARSEITDKCHGRIVRNGVLDALVSSDNDVLTTSPEGSSLAGPDGKYLLVNQNDEFVFGKGRVPVNPAPFSAMGGGSTNYANPAREGKPNQMIGRCELENIDDDKVLIFTVSQQPLGNKKVGKVPDFVADVKKSKVKDMPGGNPGELELLLMDGGSSVALAYTNELDQMNVQFKAGKHFGPPLYYINTYLLFRCDKKRQ